MTLKTFVEIIEDYAALDLKLKQFVEDASAYPELGDMELWTFLRAALGPVDCPACIGHQVSPVSPSMCRYCAGTGKVDRHLVTHPMNLRHYGRP